MKKFISLMLAAAMLCTMLPVLAAESSELEAAVLEVKTRLDIGEYQDFDSEIMTFDGTTAYYLTWSNSSEDKYEYTDVVYCDGVILNYSCSNYDGYSTDTKFPKVSKEEAKQAALAFLQKANPTVYDNIEIISDEGSELGGGLYYFNLQRTENGIPVIGQTGSISVSKDSGIVGHYNMDYDTTLSFEQADEIIDIEVAENEYAKKLSPDLCYDYYYDYTKKELNVFAKYESKDEKLVIDAKDGGVYKIPDESYFKNQSADKGDGVVREAAADLGFSQAELDEFSKLEGLISEAEAESMIRKNEIIGVTEDYKVTGISLSEHYINKGQYIYNIRFANEAEYMNVRLDAKDGTILSFYKTGDYDNKENQDREQEKKTADDALIALIGDKYPNLVYKESDEAGTVEYVREENQNEVLGDGAIFGFDSADNLVSYYLTYTDIAEFPDITGVKTPEEAFYAAAQVLKFGLAYAIDYEAKSAKPVYCFYENGFVSGFSLNPFTGRLIDYRGEEIKENPAFSYSDIENHYAKEKFQKLAEYGIGFEGGMLLPDEKITQAEYMMLLNELFGYASDIESVYKRAVSRGIIVSDERNDSSPVTRENAAVFMIREMGAEEYAKYNDIYTKPFSDVTENKGYIALLKAMGIVSGDENGNFNPKNTITRGEAMIIIYNYLSR